MAEWSKLCVLNSLIEAEIIHGYLKSSGIYAEIKSEAIGQIYALTAGPLAEVEIWVPKKQFDAASKLLEELNSNEG